MLLLAIDVDAVVVVVVVVVAVVFASFIVKSVRRKFAERPPGVPWIWMSSPRATPQYETEAAATAMPRLVWEVGPEGTPSG